MATSAARTSSSAELAASGMVATPTDTVRRTSSPSAGGDDAGGDGTDGGEREGHRRGLNPIPYDPNALRPFGPHPVPSERWIESKSLPAKIFILSAGVIMNVILALGVSTATIMGFGRGYVPAVIDSVLAGRPAELAGLQSGDSIIAIGDTPFAVKA